MNIMELGAVGELVGGIAVIGSLIYVGLQVRQSTQAQNNAAVDAAIDTVLTMNNLIASDAELARIMSEGAYDRAALERSEYFRFHLIIRGVFLQFDSVRVKREAGMVHDSLWHSQRAFVLGMLTRPEIARWWQKNAGDFSEALGAFITRELDPESGESPGRS